MWYGVVMRCGMMWWCGAVVRCCAVEWWCSVVRFGGGGVI